MEENKDYREYNPAELEPKKMSKKKKVLIGTLATLAVIILAGTISACIYVYIQVMKAPSVNSIDLSPDGYLSVIEDNAGNSTQSLYVTESNRIQVQLKNTPEYLQNAFVAIEDARFYKHKGIDLKGIARAAVKGIMRGGKFSEGASTITQQLLKNNVFSGWMSETTFSSRLSRKIQEQYLALQVEKKYSKEEILENYMNTINLGGGTRGVQVAAQYYFGKDVSNLTLAESALIAGITKNPSGYNPLKHPEDSLDRQWLVLEAMENQGYITAEEREEALEEDVIGHLVTDHSQSVQAFSWFEDALLASVVSDLMDQKGYTEDQAWDLIYNGGLTISSTQDCGIQFVCEQAANDPNYNYNGEQLSIVVTDVHTGAVVALVGGRGEKDASLIYNRATDAICQPGSTIKVVGEYAAAMDDGTINLASVFEDEPYTYSDGTEIHNASGTYAGKTTVCEAISTSSNVVALKVFKAVGMDKTVKALTNFGISTLTGDDHQEALAIGGTYNGVTNLELTAAYNTIAADGQYVRPYFYTRILDHEGNVILENAASKKQVIKDTTADLLTIGMQEVIRTGTGASAYIDWLDLAAKSGTTNDYRDSWFVGFSSNYTCGIWGGYDDHSPQADTRYTKLIWKSIMEQIPSAAVGRSQEETKLVDTSDLTLVRICKKCGKRAVTGLCDSTIQGNMVIDEYFVSGKEPWGNCDCHVSLKLCSESGKASSFYCPAEYKTEMVYLKDAAPGTADEGYAAPAYSSEKCDIHTSVWKKLQDKLEKDKKKNQHSDDDEDDDDNNSSDWSMDGILNSIFGY